MPRLHGYRERVDWLGYFLEAYDEYLDGKRNYDDLPDFPHGRQRELAMAAVQLARQAWDRTWARYSPDAFNAPPQELRRRRLPESIRAFSEPEIVELKPRRWWWPWTWARKSLPIAKVVKR